MNPLTTPRTMPVRAVAIWFVVRSNGASEQASVSSQPPKSLASIGMVEECIDTYIYIAQSQDG